MNESVSAIARRRALVIDDERELLAEMLIREGFAVEVAFDGKQALAELDRRSYDLVLSDVRMPDLDGPALLHASYSNRPVICFWREQPVGHLPRYQASGDQIGCPV
jgi:DNA-binding response OmpR family regulator